MSGYKSFNIPAFQRYAERVEVVYPGLRIVCPYELDDVRTIDWCLRSPDGLLADDKCPPGGPATWTEFLCRDLEYIGRACHGIALMPHWEESRGARVEVAFGVELGLRFLLNFHFITAAEMRQIACKSQIVC